MAKVQPPSAEETRRIAAMELAINLHNFRSDVTRNTDKVIDDAKIIYTYLENGT
jgi:hypothetical protein